MRTKRRHVGSSLAVLLAICALIAGCGGGGGQSTATTLSHAELVAKAAAICGQANSEIEAAAREYLGSGRPTPKDLERFAAEAVVPNTEAVVTRLESLTPPSSIAATYSELVDEMRSTGARLKANPGLLAQSGDPFAKANRLAKRAGLDACAGD